MCLLCSKHSSKMRGKFCPRGTNILVDSHLSFQAHFRALCTEWRLRLAILVFLFCALLWHNLRKLQAHTMQPSCKSLRPLFLTNTVRKPVCTVCSFSWAKCSKTVTRPLTQTAERAKRGWWKKTLLAPTSRERPRCVWSWAAWRPKTVREAA